MGKRDLEFKARRVLQYQDYISQIRQDYLASPEGDANNSGNNKVLSRPITWQVTDKCNLACTYCYQINKGVRRMSLETGKKLVDALLSGKLNNYINLKNSPGIILEFIGGEPFLEIELIDQIVDYFIEEAFKIHHPWAVYHMISICSNGVLYRDPRVQKFLEKHKNNISFSVTLDGNKELHDSCRVFAHDTNKGSYDLAYDACVDWMERGNYMGSKITIAPDNLTHLVSAVKHMMIDLEYDDINANCVYEEGWTLEHAKLFYKLLKEIADMKMEYNLEEEVFLSLFEENFFRPKPETENDNWCGGTGSMLSMDPDGWLFPCIRYMESSLGDERERYSIGHIDKGVGDTKRHKDRIKCLNCISRRTESTDECYYCPIADGCSLCSAYNYQVFGTPDSRATYICIMHKARALANIYYWNKVYLKLDVDRYFENNVPEEWALEIISKEELDMLNDLVNQAKSRNGVLPSNGMNGPSLSDIIDDNETSITDTDINSN